MTKIISAELFIKFKAPVNKAYLDNLLYEMKYRFLLDGYTDIELLYTNRTYKQGEVPR